MSLCTVSMIWIINLLNFCTKLEPNENMKKLHKEKIEQDMNNKYDNKILSGFVRVQTDYKDSQCLDFLIFKG